MGINSLWLIKLSPIKLLMEKTNYSYIFLSRQNAEKEKTFTSFSRVTLKLFRAAIVIQYNFIKLLLTEIFTIWKEWLLLCLSNDFYGGCSKMKNRSPFPAKNRISLRWKANIVIKTNIEVDSPHLYYGIAWIFHQKFWGVIMKTRSS